VPSLPDPAVVERPWVAAYPPGVPPTYDLPKVALGRFLDDAARDFSERDALVTEEATLDHGTLRDRADAVASVLHELGVGAGDRVLLLLPSHATTPVALFAVWRLGAVAVPLPPTTGVDELTAVIEDAAPAVAIAERETLDVLAGQPGLLPEVAVAVDGTEWRRGRRRLRRSRPRRRGRRREHGPVVALADELERLGDHRSVPPGPVPDDPALLAYPPRPSQLGAAVLTHANLVANAFQARLWIPDVQAGKERVLVADPLHEPLALTLGLLSGLLAAATVIVLADPDGPQLAAAIDRERPTLLFIRPERLAGLVDAPSRRDLTSLRVCLTLGGPLDADLAAALEERTVGARVREGYGLREAAALTHAQPVYGRVDSQSMGLPVTDTVGIVVDLDDLVTPLPAGRPGMLLVTGPQIATGTWGEVERARTQVHDGWLVTGDVVTVTADGVFHHVGRASELVHRDGTLVAPRHVEEVLERHGAVDRAVVTVLDGPALVASVVRRRRQRAGVDELLAHCRSHLDRPAVPDRIELVDELPTTPSGEVARDELHRQLTGRSPR
jgi:long-chain acyl-CoA synthetase